MAFREVIEAVLRAKDANRFKASMDKAARSVRKLGHDEEVTASQTELLNSIEKKLDRQSLELTAAITLLAHSINDLGDEMTKTAAKGEVMNKVINRTSGSATPFFKRWSFWKDRLSLTRSEIMTTGLTIGAYFAPAIVALGSSFAYAAIGGGAVAAGGMATFITGLVSLMLVIKPAINQIKKIQKAQDQYNQTVDQYGAASVQASRANAHLYAVVKNNGGPAVLDATTRVANLRKEWAKLTLPARGVFFAGLIDGLKALKNLMPMFAGNAFQMMTSVRNGFELFFKVLQTQELRQFFRSMSETFDRSATSGMKGFVYLFVVFSRVVRASLPWVEKVAAAWERTTASWMNGTTSQQKVNDFIGKGVEHFKAWWALAKALGRTLKIVFGSSTDEGLKVVKVLTDLVNKFNNWLQGMKDTGAITRFWRAYNQSVTDAIWAVTHPVQAINRWLPIVMDTIATTMAQHAPGMAAVFIQAFLNSGSWAQLLTAAWFLKRFGFFSAVGGLIGEVFLRPFAKAFIEGFGARMLATSAAEGVLGQKLAAAGAAGGTAFGKAFQVAAVAGIVVMSVQLNKWVQKQPWFKALTQGADKNLGGGGKITTFLKGLVPGGVLTGQTEKSIWSSFKDFWNVFRANRNPVHGGQGGGVIPPGGQSIVGERGPEMAVAAPRGTQVIPLSRNSRHTLPGQIDIPNLTDAMRVTVYSYINVDRREIARAVNEQAAYDASLRGGRRTR